MPLSNAERQRRYRQRRKEKVAELDEQPAWIKLLVKRITGRLGASLVQLTNEDAEELAYDLYRVAERFHAAVKKRASSRKKRGTLRPRA